MKAKFRVGLGHDSHRLQGERKLVLGGVEIDHHLGLIGHSDADVLLHAITDALLGAAGLGDIGQWFPDNDPRWAAADSSQFVAHAAQLVRERGWEIGNLDCTIFAERPKLTPYKQKMEARIAKMLGVSSDQINIKAKTGEKVGSIGREEAMSAEVIVLLVGEELDSKTETA